MNKENQEAMHPKAERLEAYVEGSLPEAARSELAAHLLTCGRCRTAVEQWELLFDALASVPHVAPAAYFAERVLAGVRVRRAWPARIAAWLEHRLPRTNRGWAMAAAVAFLPVGLATALAAWVLSRPWLDAQGLWAFMRDRAVEGMAGWLARTLEALATETGAANVLHAFSTSLNGVGFAEVGLGLALIATAVALSFLILYRNVIRTPTGEVHHASHATYCF